MLNTNSNNLPTGINRRRGRPPTYTSTQERRDATNARRRDIRRNRQTNDASMSAQNNNYNTPTNIQRNDNDVPIPTQRRRLEYLQTRVPHPEIAEDGQVVTTRRGGRSPTYASTQERREATNARRRELRRIQQNNVASNQQTENNVVVGATQQHQPDHSETRASQIDCYMCASLLSSLLSRLDQNRICNRLKR